MGHPVDKARFVYVRVGVMRGMRSCTHTHTADVSVL